MKNLNPFILLLFFQFFLTIENIESSQPAKMTGAQVAKKALDENFSPSAYNAMLHSSFLDDLAHIQTQEKEKTINKTVELFLKSLFDSFDKVDEYHKNKVALARDKRNAAEKTYIAARENNSRVIDGYVKSYGEAIAQGQTPGYAAAYANAQNTGAQEAKQRLNAAREAELAASREYYTAAEAKKSHRQANERKALKYIEALLLNVVPKILSADEEFDAEFYKNVMRCLNNDDDYRLKTLQELSAGGVSLVNIKKKKL